MNAKQAIGKQSVVIGLALFAMFFGAGNLIFPPYLGMESGYLWPIALAAFVLVDVVISCIGIYALNSAGGGQTSFEHVIGKIPALILDTAAILCTGMLIAMPRTAATTYEMSIVSNFGDDLGLFPFSLIYFAVVLALTIRESKIVDIIGKILTPLLVLGILVLIIAGIVNPIGPIDAPVSDTVVQDGILAGYQAMDVICIVGYAIVMKNTLLNSGIPERKDRLHALGAACVMAAVLLTLIYGGLTYLGATSITVFGTNVDQAQLTVGITDQLMGSAGVAILGVVVALACLTTAIGLIGSTASYFQHITNGKIKYSWMVIACIIVGILICNLGLDEIIAIASPILSLVCPPFMTTVVLIACRRFVKSKFVFQGAALGAFIASVFITIEECTGAIAVVDYLPLYSVGFGWLVFAIIGGLIGKVVATIVKPKTFLKEV